MGIHDLWLFMAAGLILNITPGPDMALIIARSAGQGARAGMAAALGVGTGTLVHIAAAAVGISAIVATSALAFTVLKWAGALYLIWLGIQIIRGAGQGASLAAQARPAASLRLRDAYLQGVLTNVLNPKVALFFLAFLPQFVDPASPHKVAAFVVLGLLFDAIATMWNLTVAWFAGAVAASAGDGWAKGWLERTLGALFIGVGVKLALTERP